MIRLISTCARDFCAFRAGMLLAALALLSVPAAAQEARGRGPSSASFEPTAEQMVGTYMAHLLGDYVVAAEGPRLVLKMAQFASPVMVPAGGGRFQLEHPNTKGWIASFRQGTFAANTIELYLIQPDGTQGTFPKRTPGPLAPELADYEGLVGMYAAGPVKGEIVNLNGRLAFYEHGWPAFPLRPAGRDVFDMTSAPGTGEFKLSIRREGGQVLGFVLKQPNKVSEYVKAGAVQVASADVIRLKAIEALGGEAQLKARRTLIQEAEAIVANISGSSRMWRRLPLASVHEVTLVIPGENKKIQVRTTFNGTKGVEVSTGKAPKAMTQSDIDWDLVDSPQEPLLWGQLYKSVEVVGPKRFDDRDCIAVAKLLHSGRTIIEYFDAATFLSAGIEGPKVLEDGREVTSVVIRKDWRAVGGIRLPFVQLIREGDVNAELRITSARWDVPVPESMFLVKEAPVRRIR